LEGLAMEEVGVFYGHLVYFTAILVYTLYQEKSGNPDFTVCVNDFLGFFVKKQKHSKPFQTLNNTFLCKNLFLFSNQPDVIK
jgi:hypothetical protein